MGSNRPEAVIPEGSTPVPIQDLISPWVERARYHVRLNPEDINRAVATYEPLRDLLIADALDISPVRGHFPRECSNLLVMALEDYRGPGSDIIGGHTLEVASLLASSLPRIFDGFSDDDMRYFLDKAAAAKKRWLDKEIEDVERVAEFVVGIRAISTHDRARVRSMREEREKVGKFRSELRQGIVTPDSRLEV